MKELKGANARYSIESEHAEAVDDVVERVLPLLERLLGLVSLFYGPDGESFTLMNRSLVLDVRRPTDEEREQCDEAEETNKEGGI